MASVLVLLRHAERLSIPEGDIGNDVPITAAGAIATKEFARKLNPPVVSVETSPIYRCVQTAKLVSEIHGISGSNVRSNVLLGDPGFFIEDGEVAWQSWLKHGSEKVNQYLLTGSDNWPGFRPFNVAIASMVSSIRNVLEDRSPGTVVWVTHDTILATFASRVLQNKLSLDDWPEFLGSLTINMNNDRVLNYCYSKNSV